MKNFALALLVLLGTARGTCQMNTGCPWLNVATASGVLKSDDHGPMATLVEGSRAACSFAYRDGTASRLLKLTVEQAQDDAQAISDYKARCSAGTTPLSGIGNAACGSATKSQTYGQEVIGRVRNQIFTVTVTTTAQNDPFMPQEALQEKARNIAEQVAGALF
jgi:hypothetical protein